MNASAERPEAVSFVVLTVLLWIMRSAPSARTVYVAGLIGGVAFLCQPFAGVIAVGLIAGWLFFMIVTVPDAQSHIERRARSFIGFGTTAAVWFLIPITITATTFYQIDHTSLARFWKQATLAGISRGSNYAVAETITDSSPVNKVPAIPPAVSTHVNKYWDALAWHKNLGPVHFGSMIVAGAIILAWLYLLIRGVGLWRYRAALLLAGLMLFVIPLAVFPLQYNYLILTRALFPVLLAFNWAYTAATFRNKYIVPLLMVANVIAVLPSEAVDLLLGQEGHSSYLLATQQVSTLRDYLDKHPLNGKVVLVPSSHYFLYKSSIGNIYNPEYLSFSERSSEVGAIVNCYASTKNFLPGTLPLPPFVMDRKWRQLEVAQDSLRITFLGHAIMSRNWAMTCDLYVPEEA
jgi:hypothetical protein